MGRRRRRRNQLLNYLKKRGHTGNIKRKH